MGRDRGKSKHTRRKATNAHPRAGNKEASTTDTQKYTRNTQNENNVIMRGDCKLATTVTYSTAIDAAVLSMILLGEGTTRARHHMFLRCAIIRINYLTTYTTVLKEKRLQKRLTAYIKMYRKQQK